jgi:23S rRNA pseudouridine1911/1915/1917 synthase
MTEKERSLIFTGEDKIRIDRYLTQKEIYPSRSQIRNLIAQGKIRVNNNPVKPSYILKNGDVLGLALLENKELKIKAEAILCPGLVE